MSYVGGPGDIEDPGPPDPNRARAAIMAVLLLGVSTFHVIGIKAGGEPARSTVPSGALHAAAGNTRAICGAPIVDVLDRPWPPTLGACADCLVELAPTGRTGST